MSPSERPLSSRFADELPDDRPDPERWSRAAKEAAGGRLDRLEFRLGGGLRVHPLYTDAPESHAPGLPGSAPFARGSQPADPGRVGWDIRQPLPVGDDPTVANTAILQELEGGASSILLQLDRIRPGHRRVGAPPLALDNLDSLDRLLQGVRLEMAGIALDAGAAFQPAAALLAALWRRRRTDPATVRTAFHADPIGTAARLGGLPQGLDRGLEQMTELALWSRNHAPQVRSIAVDSGVWHDAGADIVQDLAFSLTTGVEYLRALERGGMDPVEGASQIVFRFSVGSELFLEIAKLRAARMLWAAVLDRCGCGDDAAGMVQEVRTARRAMTRRDPWVNILRNTACCFIGATGGAEAVVSMPFDEPLRAADSSSRRLARNTQVLLNEESLLHQVTDPAGGSWAVETLTAQLCESAWQLFASLEASGGAVAALRNGTLQRSVAESAETRYRRVTRRERPLLGVSEFANLEEKLPERRSTPQRPESSLWTTPTNDTTPTPRSFEDWISALSDGAAVTHGWSDIARTAGADEVPRLIVHRLDEPFETLRHASDAYAARTGARPKVALACMGRLADHNARSSFSRNLLRAGGIEALPLRGSDDPESLVAAFIESGCEDAVLCSSDALYEAWGREATIALKQRGARRLLLAGKPGRDEAAWRKAGIDDFIHLGCDVPAAVRPLLNLLGVVP